MTFCRGLRENNISNEIIFAFKSDYDSDFAAKKFGHAFTKEQIDEYNEENPDEKICILAFYYGDDVVVFDYEPTKTLDLRGRRFNDDYLYSDRDIEKKVIAVAKARGYDMIIVDDTSDGCVHDSYIIIK